jgi:hypothetical protein
VAKLREYVCSCGHRFEHTFMTSEDESTLPTCAKCDAQVVDDDEVLGGQTFGTIVPMYKGSLKQKAGYVHTHADRPAEKGSVAVPRKAEI